MWQVQTTTVKNEQMLNGRLTKYKWYEFGTRIPIQPTCTNTYEQQQQQQQSASGKECQKLCMKCYGAWYGSVRFGSAWNGIWHIKSISALLQLKIIESMKWIGKSFESMQNCSCSHVLFYRKVFIFILSSLAVCFHFSTSASFHTALHRITL